MIEKRFPSKSVYIELLRELSELAQLEGAQATCLNILENLNRDIQIKLLRDLIKENNKKLVLFFQLISKEMTGEVKDIALRALQNFSCRGYKLNISEQDRVSLSTIKAYASPTRLKGSCIIMFVQKKGKEYVAHYFTACFNHMGIKEYFQHRSFLKKELIVSVKKQNLIELSFFEGQKLLQEAYQQNMLFGTKIAKGYSQYSFLLKEDNKGRIKSKDIILKLMDKDLSVKRAVNTYLLALKNMDVSLIFNLAGPQLQKKFGSYDNFRKNWSNPFEKFTFIKSFIQEKKKDNSEQVDVKVMLVMSDENDDLVKIKLSITLEKREKNYFVTNMWIKERNLLDEFDALNPLNYKVYCCSFSIDDRKRLKAFLEGSSLWHLTGEFDKGLCWKWFRTFNPLDEGINISQDVYGELILTEKELIIFSASLKNITEIQYFLANKLKDENCFALKLRKKVVCTVRDVYQVISQENYIFLQEEVKEENVFIASPVNHQELFMYCLEKNWEIIILDKNIKAFHLIKEDYAVEIIFHEKFSIINTFSIDIDSFSEEVPFLKLFSFQTLDEVKKRQDSWQKLIITNIIRQDKLAWFYNYNTPQETAEKLKLVIS